MAIRLVENDPADLHAARSIEHIRLAGIPPRCWHLARCTALGRPMTGTALGHAERALRRRDIDKLVTVATSVFLAALLPPRPTDAPASHALVQSLTSTQEALLV